MYPKLFLLQVKKTGGSGSNIASALVRGRRRESLEETLSLVVQFHMCRSVLLADCFRNRMW